MIKQSASLILLSPASRILLITRPQSGSYANAGVFPGGSQEKNDLNLMHTALRETYEETGVFLDFDSVTSSNFNFNPNPSLLEYTRSFISSNDNNNSRNISILPENKALLEKVLKPFSTWITPSHYKKRFRTQFYITKVQEPVDLHSFKNLVSSEGNIPIPKSGEKEAVNIIWITPQEALKRYADNTLILYPPQFYLIRELSKILTNNNYNNTKTSLDSSILKLEKRIFEPKRVGALDSKKSLVMDLGNSEFIHMSFKNGSPVNMKISNSFLFQIFYSNKVNSQTVFALDILS